MAWRDESTKSLWLTCKTSRTPRGPSRSLSWYVINCSFTQVEWTHTYHAIPYLLSLSNLNDSPETFDLKLMQNLLYWGGFYEVLALPWFENLILIILLFLIQTNTYL